MTGATPPGRLKDRASSIGRGEGAGEAAEDHRLRQHRQRGLLLRRAWRPPWDCKSVIFVPERAPEPKVTQLLIFGATVLRVRGSYEQAFQLCQRACERWGWYNRNCAINPYLVEGKKTAGLEIGEQLGWEPTDWVAVSVGDGCTIAGIWKGFREMKTLGLIARTPQDAGRAGGGRRPRDRLLPQRRAAGARRARIRSPTASRWACRATGRRPCGRPRIRRRR